MTPDAARRAARLELGGVDAVIEATRDADGLPWLEGLWQDARFSVRTLRRRPAFSLGVLSVLAIGLGAGATVFAVVNRVLLTPLPYREPAALVRVYGTWENGSREGVSPPDFFDFRRSNTAFESIGAAENSTPLVSLSGAGAPEQVATRGITAGFFGTLGVTPLLGREFHEDEEVFRGPRVVILGHSIWRAQFGGATNIVGKSISVNGATWTVVGVMPPFFNFVGAGDLFTPIQPNPVPLMRGVRNLIMIGRLKRGVQLEQARRQMDLLAERNRREYPVIDGGWGVRLASLPRELKSDVRTGLFTLIGAVALLVVLISANVASLVLSQSLARSAELAVRTSLGASAGRIVRQLLVENMLVCLAGGAVGCLLSVIGVAAVKRFGPATIPRLSDVGVDWTVVLVALAVSSAIALVAGLEPAWRASRHDVAEGMRGARTSSKRTSTRAGLVLVEVAVSVVLLIGASLLVRSTVNLQRVDPGFSTDQVLTARIAVPPGKYSDITGERLVLFWSQLLDRIGAMAGVRRAALTSELPLGGLNNPSPRTATAPGGKPYLTYLRSVSPGYLDAMRIPLRTGRFFSDGDGKRTQRVVVINDQFARDVFGNLDPVGQEITFNFRDRADTVDYRALVIGVVGSIRHVSLAAAPFREAFLPYSQSPLNSYSFAIRTNVNPLSLAQPLRGLVAAIDPAQSIGQIRPLSNVATSGLGQPRFRGFVVAGFACFALLLAAGGLYGLLTVMVAQQTKEIGIRVAIGASSGEIVRRVIRASVGPTIGGVVVGLIAAAALVRSLQALLFEVSVWDPTSFAMTPVVLLVAALAASYVPARRAARIDPIISLRAD